jgi:hypothetical protein
VGKVVNDTIEKCTAAVPPGWQCYWGIVSVIANHVGIPLVVNGYCQTLLHWCDERAGRGPMCCGGLGSDGVRRSQTHLPKLTTDFVLQGSDEERQAAGEVLTAVLEAARIVAVLLSPVTPALSARIHSQLGLEGACAVVPQPPRLLGRRKGTRAS